MKPHARSCRHLDKDNKSMHGKAIRRLYHILLKKDFSRIETSPMKLAMGAPCSDHKFTHLSSRPDSIPKGLAAVWEAFSAAVSISPETELGFCQGKASRKPQARDLSSFPLCHYIKVAFSKTQIFPRAYLSNPLYIQLHTNFPFPWIVCQLLKESYGNHPTVRNLSSECRSFGVTGLWPELCAIQEHFMDGPVSASTLKRPPLLQVQLTTSMVTVFAYSQRPAFWSQLSLLSPVSCVTLPNITRQSITLSASLAVL